MINEKDMDFLNNHILEMQEIDRNRIARDLHDSTIQQMTALIHKTELCLLLVDADPVRAKLELQSMIDNLKLSINEMREIIFNMRSNAIEKDGLAQTLKNYCAYIKNELSVNILLNINGEIKDTSLLIETNIYRIVQEACQNIIKHAKAEKIVIDLTYVADEIKLSITDDGIGFDIIEKKKIVEFETSGYGLRTMEERAAIIGGKLEISSVIGEGTVVSLVVPLK